MKERKGQKYSQEGQFEVFKDIMRSFDLQADGAVFPRAGMIKFTCNHKFGKNNQKDCADRQRKKQCFS
jgi:hypothetical protein